MIKFKNKNLQEIYDILKDVKEDEESCNEGSLTDVDFNSIVRLLLELEYY